MVLGHNRPTSYRDCEQVEPISHKTPLEDSGRDMGADRQYPVQLLGLNVSERMGTDIAGIRYRRNKMDADTAEWSAPCVL